MPTWPQGRRHFAAAMDCEPLYGGEHPGEGTANAVMALGPATYLEILGRDVNQGEQGLDPEVKGARAASGLYHWAVGGVDLTDLARRAAKAGLDGRGAGAGRAREARWQAARLAVLGPARSWLRLAHSLLHRLARTASTRRISAPRGGRIAGFEVHTPEAEQAARASSTSWASTFL